ncbi:hypothetical protein C5C45_12385 [Rathayibacter rathayi]|nr:hypothetical protein C5C08_11740 [Rathayibacter rathayi]PPH65056.1 hypothetical protein C5C45_12385 [Rathayibacter rathayi]
MLAEDTALLRDGLTSVLERFGHVVTSVADAVELEAVVEIALSSSTGVDIVITDIRMPPHHRNDGLEAAIALRARHPGLPVLVLSQYVAGAYARELLAGAEREVATGGGFVLWSDSSVAAISRGRCGTVEVAVSREILERIFAWADAGATVIPQGFTTARILLAAATTALTGPLAPRDPAWGSICSMIASGISALLAEVGPALLPSAPVTAVRLLRRAHVAIERHCRDASFDVRSLADEMSVSMTTLYSAFEHSPWTPAQAIRSARVELARRMLDHRVSPTAADREAIAELAGFVSAPAMSKALRADQRRRGG